MPTIKDVAKASGVSTATVSQVLSNGRRPVHAQTRERVLAAARALDYRPSAVARGLVQKRMNTIGVVFLHGATPARTNPYLMAVLDGVLALTTRRRQRTMLCTMEDWDAAGPMAELSDGRCDGVLLMVPPTGSALPEILRRRDVPFVIVNGQGEAAGAPCVDVDNVAAARGMTEFLLGLGHERIAFVHKRDEWRYPFVHERQEGYRQAMVAAGRHNPALANRTWEQEVDLDPAAPGRPTALFCAYDGEAIELLERLRARGVRVPEDVSVVGFDDAPGAEICRPALTTVRQPTTRIGEQAAEMLLALIEDAGTPARQLCLPTELVVRQSAAPPQDGC